MSAKKSYNERHHESHKCKKSENTSFYELLYIPTFWNISPIKLFYIFTFLSGKILNISICWSCRSESLTKWMRNKSLYTDGHAFHMTICRSSASHECFHIPCILDIYSSKYKYHYDNHTKHLYAIFLIEKTQSKKNHNTKSSEKRK